MKKYTFSKVNEDIYKETLDNGIDVYLYPFKNTKNFYITISVKYGAKYTKYKKNKKIYNITPGVAHFLEHRIMVVGEDKVISNRINKLGSLANAWTGYHATNYNIFGSENIKENIKLLLDIFYNAKFIKKDVDEEKGIISEEIDMGKDQIERELYQKVFKNALNDSYAKNTVIGEKEDIQSITCEELKRIYDDFYISNNSFVIVTGNFNKEEIIEYIKEYYSKLNLKAKELPKRIIEKENEKVNIEYEEIKKDMEDTRVKYTIKLNKKIFNIEDDSILQYYLMCIFNNNFSISSPLYEQYKNNDLICSLGTSTSIIDEYILITINATTNKPKELINTLNKDIKKLSLDKETFERLKKKRIKNFIMLFENIEDVESVITEELTRDGKIDYNEYDFINNVSYKTVLEIMKKINTNNISVIRTIK